MGQEAPSSGERDGRPPSGSGVGAFSLRATVTAAALVCLAALILAHPRVLPFRTSFTSLGGGSVFRIEPRPGVALPSPLRAGETVPLALQPFATRLALALANVSGHRPVVMVVRGAHGLRSVVVRSVRLSADRLGSPFQWAADVFFELVFFIVGILTLWWGRNWAAWGFSLATLTQLGYVALGIVPWPPGPGALPVLFLIVLFTASTFYIGLYLSVRTLLGHRVRFLHGRDLLYLLLALLGYVLQLAVVVKVLWGASLPFLSLTADRTIGILVGTIFLAQILVIVRDLVRGYGRAGRDLRLRLRWLLLAAVLLILDLGCVLWVTFHPARGVLHDVLDTCSSLLASSIVGLYAYVLLRQRLVEVRLVVSRALVFAVFMATVVGLFAFVENVIERSAVPRGADLAFEIGVPLLLGIFFHRLSRRIERLVERVFFRREYRSRQELLEFAHDVGYIEDPEVLLERAARVFALCSGGERAACYEADGEALLLRSRFPDGDAVFPPRLDTDDPALVRLRARRSPLDLHGRASALGDGLALPFVLRGRPYALFVIGPRPGGRYSEEETDFLARAAHEVGSALLALRAEGEGKGRPAYGASPRSAASPRPA